MCGDKNFFYNFDDQDNKFVEIIDYISEGEECEIINAMEESYLKENLIHKWVTNIVRQNDGYEPPFVLFCDFFLFAEVSNHTIDFPTYLVNPCRFSSLLQGIVVRKNYCENLLRQQNLTK